jgi:hypothetical protein
MNTKISVAASLALALAAAPLGAQILPRSGGTTRTGSTARDRVQTAGDVIDAARRRAGVYGDTLYRDGSRTSRSSRSSKVPPGHRPPPGMCRVWIDGVPPGQQPAPTDCATAERTRPANARVIYGDQESFPGKGRGKFKKSGTSTTSVYGRDDVRVGRDGRIYDRNGRVIGTRTGGIFGSNRVGDDEDSDSDNGGRRAKASKSRGKGKGRG